MIWDAIALIMTSLWWTTLTTQRSYELQPRWSYHQKTAFIANFAYKYDLWNNEMLVFTVHYRARVLWQSLGSLLCIFVDFFKIKAWLCQNYNAHLEFYVGGNNWLNIWLVITVVTEKLERENFMSGDGNSVWKKVCMPSGSNRKIRVLIINSC